MTKTITTRQDELVKRQDELDNQMNELLESRFKLEFDKSLNNTFNDYYFSKCENNLDDDEESRKFYKDFREDFIKVYKEKYKTRLKEIKHSLCREFYVRFYDEVFFDKQDSNFILDSDILKKKNNKNKHEGWEWDRGENYKKYLKINRNNYYKNFSQSVMRKIFGNKKNNSQGMFSLDRKETV